MGSLSKKDILEANDTKLIEIEVKEWGGSVFLGKMGLDELIEFWGNNYTTDGEPKHTDMDIMLDLLLKTLKDEEGTRLFEDNERQVLAKVDPMVLTRLFKECSKSVYLDVESSKQLKKN